MGRKSIFNEHLFIKKELLELLNEQMFFCLNTNNFTKEHLFIIKITTPLDI